MANTTILAKGPYGPDDLVRLLVIPDISLGTGQTRDMSQYIVDNTSSITDSQILNLNTNVATYSHATKLLTGSGAGTSTGLRLEVTFP